MWQVLVLVCTPVVGAIVGAWAELTVARPTTKAAASTTRMANVAKAMRAAWVHDWPTETGAEMVVALMAFPFGFAGLGNPSRIFRPPRW
jgi:hypothetical protein